LRESRTCIGRYWGNPISVEQLSSGKWVAYLHHPKLGTLESDLFSKPPKLWQAKFSFRDEVKYLRKQNYERKFGEGSYDETEQKRRIDSKELLQWVRKPEGPIFRIG
jgi:hypothetical protein